MSAVLYLTQWDRAEPRSAIAERNARGCWRAIPYDLGELRGTLLAAGPETEAAPVTLALPVSGWHAVHLGLWAQYGSGEKDHLMFVKLTDDATFVAVRSEIQNQNHVDEIFWKVAELNGQGLTIAPFPGGYRAGIAYVKLTPLSAAEVQTVRADRARRDTRRLIATVDNHGLYYTYRHTGEDDIRRAIEPFRDTDFGRLLWNNGGSADCGCFATRAGRVANQNCEDFPRVGDRLLAENMRLYLERGIDTMRVARDYTRSLGIEFHISLRMGAFQFQPPHDEVFTSPFYLAHPEWHCRDRDGSPISRLSYAFPEVQTYVLSLLEELAGYQPDGLSLIFIRGGPFLLYEEPLVAAFRRRAGLDARALAENDPDFLRFRAALMTEFVRRVRAVCDRNRREGARMALSAMVYNDETNNLAFGLDVATWAQERLVDFLLPYPRTAWPTTDLSRLLQPTDYDFFARLARDTGCAFYPEISRSALFWDDKSPGAYRRQALEAYAKGAAGLAVWDAGGLTAPHAWSMIRRLGHRDELAGYEGDEDRYFRVLPVKSVGGYRLDKYTPHLAY